MQIDLITVGKLKEKYLKEAQKEYLKRLSKFTKINLIEIPDEPCEYGEELVQKKESEKINKKIKPKTYLIILDIKGKNISSIEFSEKIDTITMRGYSHITFIIGGSYGLSTSIKEKSDYQLSFSKMTFPHQLFQIMLLEQIYRSYKIINNQTYHK